MKLPLYFSNELGDQTSLESVGGGGALQDDAQHGQHPQTDALKHM